MIKTIFAFIKVWKFFGSFRKARLWFRIPNPLLGGIAPYEMLDMGRSEKLYKIISIQLEQNKLPKRNKK